jgi:molybdopterin molybdotransferase
MISIADAAAAMLPRFAPLGVERVPLDRALGRFLAAPLVAREDIPSFDNSAMDGYAVHAADLAAAPVVLPLAGESRAGGEWPRPLARGATMRIFTGAPMPDGADAVVMQEDVERDAGGVAFRAPSRPGKHVRRRAEVLAIGAPLFEGAIGIGEIGLLASQGFAEVPVLRRPRVAILSTGDELRELGEPARPGTLIDSNSHALAAAVREAGGVPIVLPRASDDRAAIERALRDAIAASDVLVTCGGVSVGEYDLLHDSLDAIGAETIFWKVRVKPGKPIRFAMSGAVPIVALPGNPVSALLTFELFVRPGLRRMFGDPRPFRSAIDVELARSMPAPGSRTELARARLEPRAGALPLAHPHRDQGSGTLTSLVALDALVIVPEGAEGLEAGSVARALDLRSHGSERSIFE